MKPGRTLVISLVLVTACLVAVTYVGGKAEGQSDEDARLKLQDMVLTTTDLPLGLQLASSSVSTNKDIADESPDPEGTLAKLEARGRQLGYDMQFQPGSDAPDILVVRGAQSTASLYKTAAGASEALAEGVSGARATDWKTVYPDEPDLSVDELALPSGTDEGTWFRISGTDASGNLVIDDQVAFRVGAVRGFLRVVTVFEAGTGRDAYQDQVSQWVELMASRMGADGGLSTIALAGIIAGVVAGLLVVVGLALALRRRLA